LKIHYYGNSTLNRSNAKSLISFSHVQDAFVIAVEQQAKERLERLSELRKIKPVDMTKLSQEVIKVFKRV